MKEGEEQDAASEGEEVVVPNTSQESDAPPVPNANKLKANPKYQSAAKKARQIASQVADEDMAHNQTPVKTLLRDIDAVLPKFLKK